MKKNKPLISILIPTSNRLKYLKECIKSIIIQKGFKKQEIEILISDNSNNNKTKEYINKVYPNIIYNHNKNNIGMILNWNKLLNTYNGKYFLFLSDDDKFYNENSLYILYSNLKKSKLDVLGGVNRIINESGDYISSDELIKINQINVLPLTINFISKKTLINKGGMGFGGILYKRSNIKFDKNAGPAADAEFNIAYSLSHKVGIINRITFLYRVHKTNKTNFISFDKYNDYILKKYGKNKFSRKIIFLKGKIKYFFLKNLINIFLKLGIYGKMYNLYKKIF